MARGPGRYRFNATNVPALPIPVSDSPTSMDGWCVIDNTSGTIMVRPKTVQHGLTKLGGYSDATMQDVTDWLVAQQFSPTIRRIHGVPTRVWVNDASSIGRCLKDCSSLVSSWASRGNAHLDKQVFTINDMVNRVKKLEARYAVTSATAELRILKANDAADRKYEAVMQAVYAEANKMRDEVRSSWPTVPMFSTPEFEEYESELKRISAYVAQRREEADRNRQEEMAARRKLCNATLGALHLTIDIAMLDVAHYAREHEAAAELYREKFRPMAEELHRLIASARATGMLETKQENPMQEAMQESILVTDMEAP